MRWLAIVTAGLVALTASAASNARVVLGTSSAYSQMIHLDLTQTTALPGSGTSVTHQIFSSGPIPSSASGDHLASGFTYAYGAAFAFLGNFITFRADTVVVGASTVGDFGSLLSSGGTDL